MLIHYSSLSTSLVDVAMGRSPADLVIRNGIWICVQSGELIPNTDIAVLGERIAFVGSDATHTIGQNTEVIEAEGRYLSPGFLDAHMHVESSMLTVTEFVRTVIPHGTTGIFIDPHEIGNVFGLPGVQLFIDEAGSQPIHVWVQIPSCVPSSPGFETNGATITLEEIERALKWDRIIGLGEMMNIPGVFLSDEIIHTEMALTRMDHKVISGHYASADLGLPFHGYVVGGPQDDHEGTSLEDAVARIRQGMKVMLRYGSAWHDVKEGVRAILEQNINSRHFILCTDDCHSATLMYEGHMNRAIREAIRSGISPIQAIEMATLNPAEHFGLSLDIGQISPGRFADILLLNDLSSLEVHSVFAKGKKVAQNNKLILEYPQINYPNWVTDSIHLPKVVSAEDFILATTDENVFANVIGIIENQAPTRHLKFEIKAEAHKIKQDLTRDIAKVSVIDRHKGDRKISTGLVHGFGFVRPCAIASTVAHDSHQLVVVGTDDENMAIAVNELVRVRGGQIVVCDGSVIGVVPLPIGGILSDARAEIVCQQTVTVLEGFKKCGCSLNNPNMQLTLLCLVVIPELRISNLGLVDVNQAKFIPVFEPLA